MQVENRAFKGTFLFLCFCRCATVWDTTAHLQVNETTCLPANCQFLCVFFLYFLLKCSLCLSVDTKVMDTVLVYLNLTLRRQILMKFDVWKDIVSQSSYFKSRPDLVTLGGGELGGGNLKSWKTLRVEGSG